ncbi:MAG: DUF115 domain-containing protein [Treponema sp.]|nr:DUF115 domain-containing protein [Treponema sp.]MCL2238106.1 DUF115 domain-containing protein [Treponema sp.]
MIKNGKTLLSGIDPVRRAEKTADSVSIKNKTLYFCPSPIYGYGLSRFLERIENEAPDCAVLCIEADGELFELAQKNIDASLLNGKKLHITNVCEEEGLYSLVCDLWGALFFRRIEILRFTGGWQLFPDLYNSLYETLSGQLALDWGNALTLAKLGRLYIKNCMQNISLAAIYPSISQLSYDEAPVLVMGAGPSLDVFLESVFKKNQLIKKRENRNFKIICVDTCLGALRDRGIEPDLVVILESQHWNIRDFIGSKDCQYSAAIDISSLPATARILNGEGFLFFTPWTQLKIFERLKNASLLPSVFAPLGSVGLTAVNIAKRLTRGKIICAGLDFSFTYDSYHARGTPGHRAKMNKQTRLLRLFDTSAFGGTAITAVSKSGENVCTNPIMRNYRALFEQEFGGDKRIFDIDGTGLPLGVRTLSMQDAIKELNIEEVHTETQRHGEEKNNNQNSSSVPLCLCENSSGINSFYENEKNMLTELRGILTGEAEAKQERLDALIIECDYLWAHFPDCAGGRKPNMNDNSFLNRVRMEIDIMLKLVNRLIGK